MSLINELQEIAETADILIVLRKAKRVSGKLGRTDILDWINKEIDGYGPDDVVPEYRQVEGSLVYNTNGYIPAGFGRLKSGIERVHNFPSLPVKVRTDIGTLDGIPENKIMCEMLPPELEAEWKSKLTTNDPWGDTSIMHQISLMVETPTTSIKKIVQAVRDRVLDWAIKLEQEGITGDGHTFTQKEKAMAQNMNVVNFGSMKTAIQDGDNPIAVQVDETTNTENKKTVFDYVCSWYGAIVGGTASILGAWWFAWKEWGVWFLGF